MSEPEKPVMRAAMFAVTTLLDKLLNKHRLKPDDVLIPVVTSITDVLMLGPVTLAVVLVF